VTIDDVLRGEYQLWHGLEPEPALEELAARVGAIRVDAPQRQVRIATTYSVYTIQRATAPVRLDAWSPLGSGRISIVEIDDPVSTGIERVLDEMGEPEAHLDDVRLSAEYFVTEFVFARRGIVLSVGTPLTPAASRPRTLLHVRLFAPVTLQRYLTDIGEPTPSRPAVHD